MTDTPKDRSNPEEESKKPTPESPSEKETEVIAADEASDAEETEVRHESPAPLAAAASDEEAQEKSGPFNLGRTGKRIAVAAAVAAAFFSGMILYSAIDDHDSDAERAAFVAPPGGPGMPGEGPGGMPGMPGGGPGGFHEGGPGWSHDGDEDGDHEGDDYDHDSYEHEEEGDRDEFEDDRYEEGQMPPGSEAPQGYQAPPGGQNQPAPMESGQS
jgi:hypothetical protein